MTALPWRLPLACIVGAGAIGLAGANQATFLALNAAGHYLNPGLLLALTLLGNVLAGIALTSPWLRPQPRLLWAAVFAAPLATLFVQGGKRLFDLPRPAAILPADSINIAGPVLKALSFPSGHTTTIFVFAAVVFFLVEDRRWRVAALLLAAAVAASRILVGAHWPLDVLAGAFGGWLCGWLGVVWSRNLAWTVSRKAGLVAAMLTALAALGLVLSPYSLPAEQAMGWLLAALAAYFAVDRLRAYAAGQ
jgi:membrane-associated phospholipid phosphatase